MCTRVRVSKRGCVRSLVRRGNVHEGLTLMAGSSKVVSV